MRGNVELNIAGCCITSSNYLDCWIILPSFSNTQVSVVVFKIYSRVSIYTFIVICYYTIS